MKNGEPKIRPETLEKMDLSAVLGIIRSGESDIENGAFADLEIGELDLYGVSFRSCRFTRCRFAGTELGQSSFVDVILESCDLSNLNLSESFWQRCRLAECRLVGARFEKARFRQVEMQDCPAAYAGFDRAAFDRVRLEDCDFEHAYLRACKLKDLTFENCRFLGTNFYQTPLAGIDFTKSVIDGWTLSEEASELRGAVVTALQAVGLAARLGLVVKDD